MVELMPPPYQPPPNPDHSPNPVRDELLLRTDRCLVRDVEIGGIRVGFLQTFLRQFGAHGVLNLLLGQLIRVVGALDVNPLVGLELGEVGFAVEVVTNVLLKARANYRSEIKRTQRKLTFSVSFPPFSFATRSVS